MIDRTLPRIPWDSNDSLADLLEAFSAVYLSRYNDQALTARARESNRRAWDWDDVLLVPRVPGGRPGYAVVKWKGGGVNKLIVAIEGMTSLSQLWAAFVGFNSVSATNLTGHVYHAFDTYAHTIVTELNASAFFQDAFSQPDCGVVFTGFSLGAAIAEVLAARYVKEVPNGRYRLLKFGSPKVGSARWQHNNNFPDDHRNIYMLTDPIYLFPWTTSDQWGLVSQPWWNQLTFYAQNLYVHSFRENGEMYVPFQEHSLREYFLACALRRREMNNSNPWWWHNIDMYRTALTARAYGSRRDLHYRFRWLEYNDDNQWGNVWPVLQSFVPAMKELADPAPVDTVAGLDVGEIAVIGHGADRPGAVRIANPLERPRPLIPAVPNPQWRPRQTRNR